MRWTKPALRARLGALSERHSGREFVDAIVAFADSHAGERAVARRLAEDLEGSPLQGRPLRRRLRNFRPSVDAYVASHGGALPYMVRLRDIEGETAVHKQRLGDEWRTLAESCGGD